jgi:uncharacterized protein YndB with AHSA1/START domain
MSWVCERWSGTWRVAARDRHEEASLVDGRAGADSDPEIGREDGRERARRRGAVSGPGTTALVTRAPRVAVDHPLLGDQTGVVRLAGQGATRRYFSGDALPSTMEPAKTDFLTYRNQIHVEAQPERVFAIVGDLRGSVEWAGSGHIRSIEKKSDGPIGVGTRYRSSEKITMSYRADTEITAYRPNELIQWISKPAGERVPYHRWSFELTPQDGGTLLTHEVRAARALGYMGWVQRLGFLFTRPKSSLPPGMDRTLVTVKALAEKSS